MTVQCPRCRTQYKIPSERINDPRPVFKCTRCSLVFSSEPERAARGGKRKGDDTLPLPFEARKSSGRAKPPIEVDEEAPTIRSARDAAPEDEVETLADDEAEETEESDEETDGEDETEDEEGDAAEDEDETAAEDDEEEADEEPEEAP
ncbi:zinc-ribbon domain-containing protein, partial [Candidatus Binatia bacterium]|nr:zinc-ribbon domain-containing protein [Candidatus Binatia bacterium]